MFTQIITENFLSIRKYFNIEVNEVYRARTNYDEKGPSPQHFLVKIPDVKQKDRI